MQPCGCTLYNLIMDNRMHVSAPGTGHPYLSATPRGGRLYLSAAVETANLFPCLAVLQLMASHAYMCLGRLLQFSAHLGVISSLRPAQISRYSHLGSRFLISDVFLGLVALNPSHRSKQTLYAWLIFQGKPQVPHPAWVLAST